MPIVTSLVREKTYHESLPSQPKSHRTLWSNVVARLRGKLEPLYIYYHSTYDQQTWQDGDLHWADPTYKVTQSFGQVVL